MGKSLSMEYTTMEQEIKNLKKASAAFDTTAQNMSRSITIMIKETASSKRQEFLGRRPVMSMMRQADASVRRTH